MKSEIEVSQREETPESIAARFDWAVRQGNPRWLWPETSPRHWRSSLGQIETVTRHILSGETGIAKLEGAADDIGIAAFTSGMGPLLGHWIRQGLLDAEPDVRSVIERHYSHNSERMERLAAFAAAAVEALANAGIGVTVLKGMHTAYAYFPAPGTRPVSDIDLLIEAQQEPLAARVLESLGYVRSGASFGEQSWRMAGSPALPPDLTLVHRNSPWSIDLHTTLDCRYSAGAPMIRMDRALADRENDSWFLRPEGSVLKNEDLVFYLAFHASLGLISLSMLRLTELILVIRKLRDQKNLSWSRLMQKARESGSGCCAYPAYRLVNELAPETIPGAVIQALEQSAPAAVVRVVDQLTPSTCQRLEKSSFDERFMWTGSFCGWYREIRHLVFPPMSVGEMARIYRMRFWRLARGKVTRRLFSDA
jgi:hypothetical protein